MYTTIPPGGFTNLEYLTKIANSNFVFSKLENHFCAKEMFNSYLRSMCTLFPYNLIEPNTSTFSSEVYCILLHLSRSARKSRL